MKILLFFFAISLVFNCSPIEPSKTQSTDNQLVDSRDNQSYPIKKIGQHTWMLSNLNYASSSSFCYDNNAKNCESSGRLYHFNDAKTICPKGWKLPNNQDWKNLEESLQMKSTQIDSIRIWRDITKESLFKEFLGKGFAGSGSSKGYQFEGKNLYTKYWVDQDGPTGKQFGIFRMMMKNKTSIYSDQLAKMNLCCVRCIQE